MKGLNGSVSFAKLSPMYRYPLTLVCAYVLFCSTAGAAPALRVVRAAQVGTSLLHNGGLEVIRDGKPADWQPYGHGFLATETEGRNRSRAVACVNLADPDSSGASQTVTLNRSTAAPLSIRGWSKAENVSGSADAGYSLYVDIVYSDGTPLWGETASFRCGTHDWEQREFVVLPAKPVKTVTVYGLFRGHSGKVWFDDFSLEEMRTEGEQTLFFQGVPVTLASDLPQPSGSAWTAATRDGLALAGRDSRVTSLQVEGRELIGPKPTASGSIGGFLARDVAANSDFCSFEAGECRELGLKLKATFESAKEHCVIHGKISDLTKKDRAVTLVFALPIEANGWQWGDDIRRHREIQGRQEYANNVGVQCGATGTMSLYPLAAISNDKLGLALAIDMAQPAQYRLFYHAGSRQLAIAYDFGLAAETERFPGSAEFRFVLYRFEPRWGFRAAYQKLAEIYPDYFVTRAHDQGLWMPFTDIGRVEGWRDFGFKFHEGNNNVAFDDANGIMSFRYTEPMTWWMAMNKDLPRTMTEALRVRDSQAVAANQQRRRMAEISQIAAMTDPEGQPQLLFRNEPWSNGAVWSLNPNPFLPGVGNTNAGAPPKTVSSSPTSERAPSASTPELGLNAATVHWNAAIKKQLYGPEAKGQLDGEYLDSLEGYVTANLNFCREHFRYTTVPLTFASDSKQPTLFKGLAVFEFTKWFCDDVHRLGKLTFANGVPYRFTFLCPWLDVMGTETDWLRAGKYAPSADSQMALWRTMSYQKPYLLLMNTDYDAFTPDLVEKYIQRSLFYGMFPSMFSHNAAENPYWQNPKWYNRDRHLFKKYLPIIKQVAEAGWQPATKVTCRNSEVWVERFGPDPQQAIYVTLLNDTAQPQKGAVQIDSSLFPANRPLRAEDMPSGRNLPVEGNGLSVSLQSQEATVLRITTAP
jgi:hypothetical protein